MIRRQDGSSLRIVVTVAIVPPPGENRGEDPGGENGEDHYEDGEIEGVAEPNLQPFRRQHFHSDENENEGEGGFQITEFRDESGEGEVKGTQPEDREDVAGENEEGIRGDGEHRRDGIHREDQVGHFDEDEGHRW